MRTRTVQRFSCSDSGGLFLSCPIQSPRQAFTPNTRSTKPLTDQRPPSEASVGSAWGRVFTYCIAPAVLAVLAVLSFTDLVDQDSFHPQCHYLVRSAMLLSFISAYDTYRGLSTISMPTFGPVLSVPKLQAVGK